MNQIEISVGMSENYKNKYTENYCEELSANGMNVYFCDSSDGTQFTLIENEAQGLSLYAGKAANDHFRSCPNPVLVQDFYVEYVTAYFSKNPHNFLMFIQANKEESFRQGKIAKCEEIKKVLNS